MRPFDHGRRDDAAADRLRLLFDGAPPSALARSVAPAPPHEHGVPTPSSLDAGSRGDSGLGADGRAGTIGGIPGIGTIGGDDASRPGGAAKGSGAVPDWLDPVAFDDLHPARAGAAATPPCRPAATPPRRPAVIAPRRRLLSALTGELDPGPPGVRVLVMAGLAAALLAGAFLWLSRPRPQTVPRSAGSPTLLSAASTTGAAPGGSPVTGAAASSAPGVPAGGSPAGSVVVHVAGKVRHPGVVTLPAGSRVVEAIEAAGGVRPGAGTGTLNLARRLVDGEQILVGVASGAGSSPGAAPLGAVPGVPGSGPGAGTGGAPAPEAPLDLNAATPEQFQQLPGVGPVLAQRILDYRTAHGGFRSVDELQQVTGIGSRRFADLKPLVRV